MLEKIEKSVVPRDAINPNIARYNVPRILFNIVKLYMLHEDQIFESYNKGDKAILDS